MLVIPRVREIVDSIFSVAGPYYREQHACEIARLNSVRDIKTGLPSSAETANVDRELTVTNNAVDIQKICDMFECNSMRLNRNVIALAVGQ